MATVNPIPEGFHTVTPHLVVQGAADAVEFYQQAFGAKEIARMPGPRGKLMHVELRIGDSRVMLADELPEHGRKGPKAIGGSPVSIHLYVEDADATFERAIAAGATVVVPLEDTFWGDRQGRIEDPFGHHWSIASRTEQLSHEDILMRAPTMEA
jgi:uncharacterized glyoxalase superfamily protein PhnB